MMSSSSLGRNGHAGSRSMQQNGSIPSLRIQSETPISSTHATPVPDNGSLQLPVLAPRRSIVTNGNSHTNGVSQEQKSPFVTPRNPGHSQANTFINRPIKQELGENDNFCPQCISVRPKQKSYNGYINTMSQNVQLHVSNERLETQTPTPSEISNISMSRHNMQTSSVPDRSMTSTPFSQAAGKMFVKQDWDHYKPLPGVNNLGGSVSGSELMDQQSTFSVGIVAHSVSSRTSLSPYHGMEISPSVSIFPSPIPSVKRHTNKRVLSSSPSTSEYFDLASLIRTSPTSLVAYVNGSRGSSVSVSPQPGLERHGQFGHFIARMSSRNSSGSGSSGRIFQNFTPPKPPYEGSFQNCLSDIVSNQVVVQQKEVPMFEQRAFEDIQLYGAPQPKTVQTFSQCIESTPSMAPPPPYNEAVGQQTQRYLTQQQQLMPPPQAPGPGQILRQQNSHQQQQTQCYTPRPLTQNSNENNICLDEDGEVDENDENKHICRWIDCNLVHKEQDELVRHIEKAHIDQRKGDDFTCFWSGCQRRYKPFNARYKLLIHMRVHSGEKPNKCTFEGCNKAFSRLENLKIHLRSHTGERPYVCQQSGCQKAFSNSSDRAKHQRTHQDTKPYACQFSGCNKRYTDPSSLRKHVKNHNQKDPQQKKKLKKEGEMQGSGQEDFTSCLTIQRLARENSNMEHPESTIPPPSDFYSVFNISNQNINPAPVCSEPSPGNSQDTQLTTGSLDVVHEANENIPTYSPAPPPMTNLGQHGYPFPMRTGRSLYPGMEGGGVPPPPYPNPNLYQQYMQNGQSDGQMLPPLRQYHNFPQRNFQMCDEFGNMQHDMQRNFNNYTGHPDFPDEMGFQCGQEEAQTQYLQLTAVDRCSSRMSAIYADGTN